MDVIGGPDINGVEVISLQKLAEIVVGLGCGKFLGSATKIVIIDITEGDDVLAGDGLEVRGSAVGYADDAKIQFLIGRGVPGITQCREKRRCASCKRGLFEKFA